MTQHLAGARESARETYERRRARAAAEILSTIPPDRWDDMTRNIVATLAGRRPIPVRAIPAEETIYEDAQGFTSCHSGVCGECDACRTNADDPLQIPPRAR